MSFWRILSVPVLFEMEIPERISFIYNRMDFISSYSFS